MDGWKDEWKNGWKEVSKDGRKEARMDGVIHTGTSLGFPAAITAANSATERSSSSSLAWRCKHVCMKTFYAQSSKRIFILTYTRDDQSRHFGLGVQIDMRLNIL